MLATTWLGCLEGVTSCSLGGCRIGIDAQVLCWKLLCWSSRRKSYCIIINCLVLLAWSGARIFFLGRLPLNDDIQCLRRASLKVKLEQGRTLTILHKTTSCRWSSCCKARQMLQFCIPSPANSYLVRWSSRIGTWVRSSIFELAVWQSE